MRSNDGHGRIVHEIGDGRSIAFDATIRDPEVDKIFDPAIEQVKLDMTRANRELRDRLRNLRRQHAAAKRAPA